MLSRPVSADEELSVTPSCRTVSIAAILRMRSGAATMTRVRPEDATTVYRTEVLAIIGPLSDLVVDVRAIRKRLEEDDEEEEDQERS